jgi:hypothetical protein
MEVLNTDDLGKLAAIRNTHCLSLGMPNVRAEFVPAAVHGRVDTLLVRLDEQRWRRFREGSGEVSLDEEGSSESEDLVDLAAVHTLAAGGRAYPLGPGELPGLAAAELRC